MTVFEIMRVGGVSVLCLAIGVFILRLIRSSLPFRAIDLFWISVLSMSLFGATYFSPVDYSEFDPLGNLLTAQSLIQRGTTRLDEYIPPFTGVVGWHLRKKQGYSCYHYPLGTPVYIVPFVWIANRFGFEMAQRKDDIHVQHLLSSLSVALAGMFIYLICRQQSMSGSSSFLLTGIFTFGSSITSTMGTALWSINGAMLFILLSVLTLLSINRIAVPEKNLPYFLGLFLFSAYLCRPTTAIFVMLIFVYMLLTKQGLFWKVVITWTGLLGCFILFSVLEYKQILPDYYLPGQLGHSHEFWTAVYGHLFSPARGLLVYSPYLFLTFIGVLYGLKLFHNKLLVGLFLIWIILHLILISKNEMWWGGGCYGSRMFADVLPGFLLITLQGWQVFNQNSSRLQRRIVVSFFILSGGMGICINTCQGLYNPNTIDWGGERRHIFDWQYPQFLANHENLGKREIRDQENTLEPYCLGETIYPDSHTAIFTNWYWSEGTPPHLFRWSRGTSSQILFNLLSPVREEHESFVVEVQIGSFGEQPVHVRLNTQHVGDIIVHPDNMLTTYTFPVPASFLMFSPDVPYQILEFLIPHAVDAAHMFGKGWVRAIGIRLYQIRLRPVSIPSEKTIVPK